jgi:hypothetical protein
MKQGTRSVSPGSAPPDPGARLCGHENRIHPLGGGIFVCFGCWTRTLTGSAIREQAIENVDRQHGYTLEFSSTPREHVRQYDDEERRLAHGEGSRR